MSLTVVIMPIYNVELNDGRKISIDADTQDAALAGATHFLSQNPKSTQSQAFPNFVLSDGPDAVRSNAAAIQQARNQGYSDDDIAGHLASNFPSTLLNHLSGNASASAANNDGPWRDYQNLPPLPAGFHLEHPDGKSPALPDGFVPERPGAFDSLPPGHPMKFDDLPKGGPQANAKQDGPWTDFQQQQDAPLSAAGSAKAAATGAGAGIAGLPRDLIGLGNLIRKIDPINALPGLTKQEVPVPSVLNKIPDAVSDLYQPQNQSESVLKKGAEIVAPAMIGGAETLAGKGLLGASRVLASRAIKQGAIPAAASSGVGWLTQGTEAEPYARVGAALLAGTHGTKSVPEPIRSADIGAAADAAFTRFRQAPVTVKPDLVETAAKNIQNDLAASGLSKAPANDMIAQYLGNKTPVSLDHLQETRSLLGKAAKQSDTPEGVAAIRAKQAIDGFMSGLQPSDTVIGANALPQALADLKQGRALSAVQNQLEQVENATYRGQINSAASDGDAAKAQRQAMKNLLLNKQAMARLSQYQPDVQKIAEGTLGMNALRKVANITGGSGGWHSGPYWLAALLAEPMSGAAATALAATPFIGMALKKLEASRTLSKVNNLRDKIGSQAPALPRPPQANPWPARALIGALAAQPGNGQ